MNKSFPTFHFIPRRLQEERKKVEKKYQEADRVSGELSEVKLPKLLDLIKQLSTDKESLSEFAKNLKRIDVNILASEYPYEIEDKELLKKIIIILSVTYNRIVGKRFWGHFQLMPKDKRIHKLLYYAFRNEDENYLALKPAIRENYEKIFASDQVLDSLATAIGKQNQSLEQSFQEWKIKEGSTLENYLWTLILYKFIGEEWFIQSQDIKVIEDRLENMKVENYKKVINRYLENHDFEAFHERLIQQLLERLGDPRESLLKWKGFTNEVIGKVRKWLFERELSEFLDYERFQYWKKYTRDFNDVNVLQSPPVAAMYFNGFVVVEFAEKDNAAYFYKTEGFEVQLSKYLKPGVSEKKLKNRQADYFIEKLSHNMKNGTPAWYSKFNEYITQYKNGNFKYKRPPKGRY